MTELADFLNEGEKTRIEGGVKETRRALALSRTIQLVEALGVPNTHDVQFVDALRVRIEAMTPKQVKMLAKGLAQATGLISEVLHIDDPSEPAVLAPEQSVVAEELTVAIPEIEGLEASLHNDALEYLELIVGDTKELGITTNDAPHITTILIELRGDYRKTKMSLDYQQILMDRFSNLSLQDIAKRVGTSRDSLGVSMRYYQQAILSSHEDKNLQQMFAEKLVSLRALSTESEPSTIQDTTPKDMIEAEKENIEEIEINFRTVGDEWAERLDLNRQHQDALKEFLNPHASPALSPNKQAVVENFIEYITKHFGSIDNSSLNLVEAEILLLRHMTGAWYKKTNNDTANRPPKPMALVINKLSSVKKPEVTESTILNALHSIALIDAQRLKDPASFQRESPVETVTPRTPRPQPPMTRLHIVEPLSPDAPKNNVEISKQINALSKSSAIIEHDEWRQKVGDLLQQQFIQLGNSTEQAATLWQMLHFDDDGSYVTDSAERRTVMATLQERLAVVDGRAFNGKERSLVGLKLLATAPLGIKTLDDVMRHFEQTDPTITKEVVELEIARGVGTLLR